MHAVIFLSNNGLQCYQRQAGEWVRVAAFPEEEAGHGGWATFVADWRVKQVAWVVDFFDEDFRLETVPKVSGRDLRQVLNRRLEQQFRGLRYRQAQVHAAPRAPDPSAAAAPQALLAGLPSSELVDRWLEPLLTHEVAITGVYSPALLLSVLAQPLQVQGPHTLVVCCHPGDGLRQSYFQNGQLRFSRLSRVNAEGIAPLLQALPEETGRTLQYLVSMRMMGRQDGLQVLVLTTADTVADMQAALRDTEQYFFDVLSWADWGQKLHLGPVADAASFWAQSLSRSAVHAVNYAPATVRRFHLLRLYQGWGRMVMLVLLLLALAVSGWFYWQSLQIQAQNLALQQQTSQVQEQKAQDLRVVTQSPWPPAHVAAAVGFVQGTLQGWPRQEQDLTQVAEVLAHHPAIYPQTMAWAVDPQSAPKLESLLQEDSKTTPGAAAVDPATGVPAPALLVNNAADLHHFVWLRGRVEPFAENYKHSFRVLEAWYAEMRDRGWEVTPLAWPLDVSPQGQINRSGPAEEAHFEVRIQLREQH